MKATRTVKKATTIGLISKQATLHVQDTFFVHFFAVVLHDCYVKLPQTSFLVTSFMEGMSDVFLFTLFSLSLIFTLVAASIPPLQNLILFLQQKMSPFFPSLVVSASQDAGGQTLSRQINLTFGIGLHVVGVRTVVRTLRKIFSDG